MKSALPALVLTLGLPAIGWAQALEFPSNAELTMEQTTPLGSYAVPLEPFGEGILPAVALEGAIIRQAWRIEAEGLSTLQILAPLRDQLFAQGFEPLLECETEGCGGFDFRFATSVLPAPAMFVDLGDFRFVSAMREVDGGEEAVSLLVSQSAGAGFVQLIRISPEGSAPQATTAVAPPVRNVTPAQQGSFAEGLETDGHVVLADLTFETGSSQLGPGPYQSLMALAAYLRANPDRTVALVGHTDAEGSLEGNIALSRRRAGSVLERLVNVYSIPRRQMEAQGMGYLAPVSSNLTPEGREANRRVEVIVTSTAD
ncbi:OmpA family protein [Flavimaricola marinus]|uniref:Outer membrane porin F n=1 Tax=Flavimaricola marinus TaxID=1819565 RepID=A0A238LHI4_9RHOB|nr:OmpA family protein [Flavimaricola marinus]SMY08416.1 Outer membrane porin F precursor [Flavimaricola marinus]